MRCVLAGRGAFVDTPVMRQSVYVSARRSRLLAQHPVVASALAAVPSDRLGEVVRVVVTVAARTRGVPELCEASSDLDELAADLDDVAWRAQLVEERGDRSGVSYDEAFQRARAVAAWRKAATAIDADTASDAVYEALHSLGGDSAAEAHVVELLQA